MKTIETDYLVVGAGATGMAFVDSLLSRSDADIVIVDRRHAPGGHWHDAYPFVRLHQAAACYGVDSTDLGQNRIDDSGYNDGMYELSSADEICHYFADVMNRVFLSSGRVRFLPMTEFREDADGTVVLTSLLSGVETVARVRTKLVDATYIEPDIPARRKPAFGVDTDVAFVPPNELVDLGSVPSGFTVIGAGKTGMDVCSWLLSNGVDPEKISWIRSRDGWYIDRSLTQPLDLVHTRIRYQSLWAEAAAHSTSGPDLAHRLEEAGLFCRLDPSVEPTQFRGATISRSELSALTTIGRVSRTGRVRHIDSEGIDFDNGRESRPRGEVYIDCTATGLRTIAPRPLFEPGRITLQYVTPGYACWSAATLAVIEATRSDDAEKNALSLPVVYTGHVDDLLHFTHAFMRSAGRRQAHPDLAAWSASTRLNPARGLQQRANDPRVGAALSDLDRWRAPALANLDGLVPMSRCPDACRLDGLADSEETVTSGEPAMS